MKTQKQLLKKLNQIKSKYETCWAIREENQNLIVCLAIAKKTGVNKYQSIKSIDIERIKK